MMTFEQLFVTGNRRFRQPRGELPIEAGRGYGWSLGNCASLQRIETHAVVRRGVEQPPSIPSSREHDVARRNVQQIDSKFLERVQDPLDLGPAVLELLTLVRFPIRPDLLGKLRPRVKVSPGEIQNEWGLYNRHFDQAQSIVGTDQLRHIESEDPADPQPFQPLIHQLFGKVSFIPAKYFEGNICRSALVFGHQYDTVFSRAQCLGELESPPGSIKASVRNQAFVHDSKSELRRTFGTSGDALGHQWFVRQHHPHGPRLSFYRRRPRPSAGTSYYRAPSGRRRAPVASKPAGRHFQDFNARRSCPEQVTGTGQKQETCFTSALRKRGRARGGAENVPFQNRTRYSNQSCFNGAAPFGCADSYYMLHLV